MAASLPASPKEGDESGKDIDTLELWSGRMFDLISLGLAKCLRRPERSFSLLTTTDEIGVGVRLGESYYTLLRTLMQSIDLSPHAFADRVFLPCMQLVP